MDFIEGFYPLQMVSMWYLCFSCHQPRQWVHWLFWPNGALTPLFMNPLRWHAPYEAVYDQPPPIVEADIRGTTAVHRVERELSSFDSWKRIWQCLKNEWRPEQVKGALSAHLKLVTWFFFDFNLLISSWIYIAQSNWHLGFMDRTKTSIR